jgi:hypothetical protein
MDLLVVACLLAAPEDCREHRVRVSIERGDPMFCVMNAAPFITEWAAAHPNWRLKSWRCVGDDGGESI